MFNPIGNTLPRCLRSIDHQWQLLEYKVVVQLGPRVVALYQCVKCRRLKVEPLTREQGT